MKVIHNIAIVDDDRIFHLTSSKAIEYSGLVESILPFKNGEEAIKYIQENINNPEDLPELILLDINMPVLDGWGFLNEFKKINTLLKNKITIYITSSSTSQADLAKANEYDTVSKYLIKPISRAFFTNVLQEYLGNQSA